MAALPDGKNVIASLSCTGWVHAVSAPCQMQGGKCRVSIEVLVAVVCSSHFIWFLWLLSLVA